MKKYFDWFGIIPIAMVGMLTSMNTHKEMEEHAKKNCVAYLYYLLIFIMLYLLLVYAKLHRYVAVFIAVVIWVVIFLARKMI